MSNLLWFIICLLSCIPAVTCWIYYYQRLLTRKEQLKQTLISMQLKEPYMAARHGDVLRSGRGGMFRAKFTGKVNRGLRPKDYGWPGLLTTPPGLAGWFLAL